MAIEQMKVQGYKDVPALLTSTSLPQQWDKPRGDRILAEPVSQMVFARPNNLSRKRRPIMAKFVDERKISIEKEDLEALKRLKSSAISYLVEDNEETMTELIDTPFGQAPVGSALSYHVCLVDFNEEAGRATKNELSAKYGDDKVIFCKCNITSQSDLEGVFQKMRATFGRLDIVVNNAGIGGEADDFWERVVDVNMKGSLRGMRLAMHYLRRDNGGSGGVIINNASAAGLNPNPFSPVYCCTKAGIIQATRCYAMSGEAAKSGLRVNVMCPAFVDTSMLRNLSAGDQRQVIDENEAKVKAFVEHVGVQTVEEISEAFMELVTNDSRNGNILWCSKNGDNKFCTIKIEDAE